jgi:hypothetical protein
VKAFHFHLDQALSWRETQVSLQKTRLAAAVAQMATISNSLETQHVALSNAATRILHQPTGDALQSYAAFKTMTLSHIRDLEAQAAAAQRSVALEMNRLIEANQKVRLLENLKHTAQTRWRHDFDHELAVFADEAFLSRRQSTLQSK